MFDTKPVQLTLVNLPNIIPGGATQLALAAAAAFTQQVLNIFLARDIQHAPLPVIDVAQKSTRTLVQQNPPQATWDAGMKVAQPQRFLSSVAQSGVFALKSGPTPTQLSQPGPTTATVLFILVAIMIIVAASARFAVERLSEMPYNTARQYRGTPGGFSRRPNAPSGSSSGPRVAGGSGGGSGGNRRPQVPNLDPELTSSSPVWIVYENDRSPRRHGGGPPPPPPPSSTTAAARRNRCPSGPMAFFNSAWLFLFLGFVCGLWSDPSAFIKRLRNASGNDAVKSVEAAAGRNSTTEVAKPQSRPQCTNTIPLRIASAPTRVTQITSSHTALQPPMTAVPIEIPQPETVQIKENPLAYFKFTLLSASPSTSYPMLLLLFAFDFFLAMIGIMCVSSSPLVVFGIVRYLLCNSWSDIWLDLRLGVQLVMGGNAVVDETRKGVWRNLFQPTSPTDKREDASEMTPQTEQFVMNSKEQLAIPSTLMSKLKIERAMKSRAAERKVKSIQVASPVQIFEIKQEQAVKSFTMAKKADIQQATPPSPIPELEQTTQAVATEDKDESKIAGPSVPTKRMLQGTIRPKISTLRRHRKSVPLVLAPAPEVDVRMQSPAVEEKTEQEVFLPQLELEQPVPSPAPESEETAAQADRTVEPVPHVGSFATEEEKAQEQQAEFPELAPAPIVNRPIRPLPKSRNKGKGKEIPSERPVHSEWSAPSQWSAPSEQPIPSEAPVPSETSVPGEMQVLSEALAPSEPPVVYATPRPENEEAPFLVLLATAADSRREINAEASTRMPEFERPLETCTTAEGSQSQEMNTDVWIQMPEFEQPLATAEGSQSQEMNTDAWTQMPEFVQPLGTWATAETPQSQEMNTYASTQLPELERSLDTCETAEVSQSQEINVEAPTQIPVSERQIRPLPNRKPRGLPQPDLSIYSSVHRPDQEEAIAAVVAEEQPPADVVALETRVNENMDDFSCEDNAATDVDDDSEEMEEVHIPKYMEDDEVDYDSTDESDDSESSEPHEYIESTQEDKFGDRGRRGRWVSGDQVPAPEPMLPRAPSLECFLFEPRRLNREDNHRVVFPFYEEAEILIPVTRPYQQRLLRLEKRAEVVQRSRLNSFSEP